MATELVTRINKANKDGSYKSTIPVDIIRNLGLKIGDKVEWDVEEKSGKKYATMRKVQVQIIR